MAFTAGGDSSDRGHAGAGEGGEGILGGVSLVPDVCGERLVRWAVWSPKKIG